MNIIEIFEDCISRYGSNPMIMEKQNNEYLSLSYQDIYNKVKKFSIGLLALGIKPRDKVALYADSGTDWLVAEFSLFCIKAVVVPLSQSMTDEQELKHCLLHSKCRGIVVSEKFYASISKMKDSLPSLNLIILLAEYLGNEFDVVSSERVYALGRDLYEAMNEELSALIRSISYDDVAMIYYTDVQTKKEVVSYTHRNLVTQVDQMSFLMQIGEWKRSYMMLPWSDIYVHQISLMLIMFNGSTIVVPKVAVDCFCYSFFRDLHDIRPNFVYLSLSAIKTIKNRIEEVIAHYGKFYLLLLEKYIKLVESTILRSSGYWDFKLMGVLSPFAKIIDSLICKKIREALGGDIEYFILRGPFLDRQTELFFLSIGIPVLRGFGTVMSSSLVSLNFKKNDCYKLGSSGKPFHNTCLKIVDPLNKNPLSVGEIGEIYIRSESIVTVDLKDSKNPIPKSVEDWYSTKWFGFMDLDGFLFVDGVLHSYMKNSIGEKFSPHPIEVAFYLRSPFISQCFLSNSGMDFAVMLVVPNRQAILSNLNPSLRDEQKVREAIRLLYASLRNITTELKDQFSNISLPKTFVILGERIEFRKNGEYYCEEIDPIVVEQLYNKEIKYAYSVQAKNPYNPKNLSNMLKMLSRRKE
jgi:long-chain acyl-CoA synthetase